MTDDNHPEITRLEVVNSMLGLAAGIRALYLGLIEEGFNPDEAAKLTMQYVHGIAGGKTT